MHKSLYVSMLQKLTKLWVVIVIVLAIGWIKNVIKLIDADFEAPCKTEVVRTISLIPPIGGFTGWMDIGEENED